MSAEVHESDGIASEGFEERRMGREPHFTLEGTMDYATLAGHPLDFEVQYRFYGAVEGGRASGQPYQYWRCDWAYDGDDISSTGLYMIWPEFLNDNGLLLLDGERIPISGTAGMWIVSQEMRVKVHRNRIKDGIRGYFMEGSRRVAEAVVTRVIGLHTNCESRPC